MAIQFKIGDIVKENTFIMENGSIEKVVLGETDGIVYYLVKYLDAQGNETARYFAENLLLGQ